MVFCYDTIGGCEKITLSFGWFWIKYQFFNSISFGAAGLYLVTNAKSYCAFWAFVVKPHFCCQSLLPPRCC